MKILIMSLGTRGDVEPFLAIGEKLAIDGHEITCAFSEKFGSAIENTPMEFISLGDKFMDVIDSPVAKKAFGGSKSGLAKFFYHFQLALQFIKIEKDTITRQYQIVRDLNPDLIVHNSIATYPFIWSLDHPDRTVLVVSAPYYIHYVKSHPYIIFRKNFGPYINKLTYEFALSSTVKSLKRAIKILKLPRHSNKKIRKKLLSVRTVYAISNSLFSRPDYWEKNLQVLGFYERNKSAYWSPPEELTEFLSLHKKVLLISFGSMTNPQPESKTKMIIEVLEKNKIPAVIITASGGLVIPETFNKDLFYFASNIPYDWIMPKIYGVVHHGGSGTTHNTIKYGCASLAIPHVFDQFVWNKIIHQKELGPKGVKIGRLNKATFEPLIIDLYNNPIYKSNAERIMKKLKEETSSDRLINFIVDKSV